MTFSTARRLALKGALACAFASTVSFPAFADEAVLRVSAIPDEAPTELQRKFAPLGKYLEAQTGMKVVFTPVSDYAAVVESLATKKIDLAWLGGFTFVQAKIRTNGTAIPIASARKMPNSPPNSSPPTRRSRAWLTSRARLSPSAHRPRHFG
jgi:phosphonate transport system substrate-binding protein